MPQSDGECPADGAGCPRHHDSTAIPPEFTSVSQATTRAAYILQFAFPLPTGEEAPVTADFTCRHNQNLFPPFLFVFAVYLRNFYCGKSCRIAEQILTVMRIDVQILTDALFWRRGELSTSLQKDKECTREEKNRNGT